MLSRGCSTLLYRRLATMSTSTGSSSLPERKKALRALVRRNLREFPIARRQDEDKAIQAHVLSSEWFKESSALCAYLSCAGLREIDTSQIVENVLQPNDSGKAKQLYVPRVLDRQANMSMLHVSSLSDMVVNSMGIREPTFNESDGRPRLNVMDAEAPVDLLLLPGLAFDRAGRRLGRGGGYYDKFLEKYLQLAKIKGWRQPLLVALAYSVQVLEEPLPVDEMDIAIDALLLSTGILPTSEYGMKRVSQPRESEQLQ